ncbi:MAG: hypothetical protein AVDCRST_MAG89-1120, partial [uncultured Gemmatimonadetes bacterium]
DRRGCPLRRKRLSWVRRYGTGVRDATGAGEKVLRGFRFSFFDDREGSHAFRTWFRRAGSDLRRAAASVRRQAAARAGRRHGQGNPRLQALAERAGRREHPGQRAAELPAVAAAPPGRHARFHPGRERADARRL